MAETWRGIAKLLMQPDLPGGAPKQVRAANNIRYAHGRVVDNNRQLIRMNPISPPDHEVSSFPRQIFLNRAINHVVESDNCWCFRHAYS